MPRDYSSPRSMGFGDRRGATLGDEDTAVGFHGKVSLQQTINFTHVPEVPEITGNADFSLSYDTPFSALVPPVKFTDVTYYRYENHDNDPSTPPQFVVTTASDVPTIDSIVPAEFHRDGSWRWRRDAYINFIDHMPVPFKTRWSAEFTPNRTGWNSISNLQFKTKAEAALTGNDAVDKLEPKDLHSSNTATYTAPNWTALNVTGTDGGKLNQSNGYIAENILEITEFSMALAVPTLNSVSTNVEALITNNNKVKKQLDDLQTKYGNLLTAVGDVIAAQKIDHSDIEDYKTFYPKLMKMLGVLEIRNESVYDDVSSVRKYVMANTKDIVNLRKEFITAVRDIHQIETHLGEVHTDLATIKSKLGSVISSFTSYKNTVNANWRKLKKFLQNYGFSK